MQSSGNEEKTFDIFSCFHFNFLLLKKLIETKNSSVNKFLNWKIISLILFISLILIGKYLSINEILLKNIFSSPTKQMIDDLNEFQSQEKLNENQSFQSILLNNSRKLKSKKILHSTFSSNYFVKKNLSNENLNKSFLNIRLLTIKQFLKEIQKELKIKIKNQKQISFISNRFGLKKKSLKLFLYQKNNQIISIRTFIQILDLFQLNFSILPK